METVFDNWFYEYLPQTWRLMSEKLNITYGWVRIESAVVIVELFYVMIK